MKHIRVVAVVCSLVLLALAIAPGAKAAQNNKVTELTFTEPFEVPGVNAQVLPAGTYVFKLLDSSYDRNIVQISNPDQTRIYTTILAIPNYRLKPTDKTVLTFGERGSGQPEAIKAWFSPGETWGQEFVYPKKRAIELARIVNQPVLSMPVEPVPATVVELKRVPVEAVQPTGEVVPLTAVVEAPPARPVEQAQPAVLVAQAQPETLPQTASSLPLFALIGLLSLCAGFTLLIVAKRAA